MISGPKDVPKLSPVPSLHLPRGWVDHIIINSQDGPVHWTGRLEAPMQCLIIVPLILQCHNYHRISSHRDQTMMYCHINGIEWSGWTGHLEAPMCQPIDCGLQLDGDKV